MRMERSVAVLALALSAGAAWAQEGTVPVSVEGTVVEVPSDIAAAACGLDDDQLEAAEEGVTATEVETAATTTGTTDDTSEGTTNDVTAAGDNDVDDAGEGDDASDDVAGAAAADDGGTDEEAGEAAGDDDGAGDDDADDVETADASGATPLCEISQEEATAQGIELP